MVVSSKRDRRSCTQDFSPTGLKIDGGVGSKSQTESTMQRDASSCAQLRTGGVRAANERAVSFSVEAQMLCDDDLQDYMEQAALLAGKHLPTQRPPAGTEADDVRFRAIVKLEYPVALVLGKLGL